MLLYYFKALLLGMIIALPFGPVGFLCLHRAVAGGVLAGLISGTGAALADGFYGAIAAFGLQFLSNFLTSHHYLIQFFGGFFLLFMGIRLSLQSKKGAVAAAVPSQADELAPQRLGASFVSSMVLAGANPMTIVAFLAFFASFGLGGTQTHWGHALAVVLGVFSGSMVWWVAIAFGGGRLREKAVARMPLLQRASGAVVLLFGLWAVGEAGFVMLR